MLRIVGDKVKEQYGINTNFIEMVENCINNIIDNLHLSAKYPLVILYPRITLMCKIVHGMCET